MRAVLYNPVPDHLRIWCVIRQRGGADGIAAFSIESEHESRTEAVCALLAAEARDRPALVS